MNIQQTNGFEKYLTRYLRPSKIYPTDERDLAIHINLLAIIQHWTRESVVPLRKMWHPTNKTTRVTIQTVKPLQGRDTPSRNVTPLNEFIYKITSAVTKAWHRFKNATPNRKAWHVSRSKYLNRDTSISNLTPLRERWHAGVTPSVCHPSPKHLIYCKK